MPRDAARWYPPTQRVTPARGPTRSRPSPPLDRPIDAPQPPLHRNPIARLANLRPGEGAKTAWAVAFFFFVLFGYFLIRPVREALGVERGMSELRWLFVGTLGLMLVANPIYAWIVQRWDRRVSLPLIYHFFVLNMLGFAALLAFFPDVVGVATGRTFFVWLSVFNLFCTTLFWVLMADGFKLEQAKRLFPLIAVGGTLGASAGSWIASTSAEALGHPGLILAAAGGIELAVFCCWRLTRQLDREATTLSTLSATGALGSDARCACCKGSLAGLTTGDSCATCGELVTHTLDACADTHSTRDTDGEPSGVLDGLRAVIRSPYLLGVCGYILLLTVFATFLYFAQARIVADAADDTLGRTRLFAMIDLATQLTTLVLQVSLTARLIRRIGVGWTLTILPLIAALGFVALGLGEWLDSPVATTFIIITVVQALYRAGKYAVARPARETLFTVVTRDEKYKAKGFIDTFVYRGGDALGAGADSGLSFLVAKFPALFGSVLGALAVTIAPLAILWAGLGLFLGARQKRLAAAPLPTTPTTGTETP